MRGKKRLGDRLLKKKCEKVVWSPGQNLSFRSSPISLLKPTLE